MASLKNIPLFTIAIPTYNRSKYLDRNLQYLYLQKQDLNEVELIVSDNGSTDDTSAIVGKYQLLGLDIKYIKNSENKGPDFNIAQCYKKALGTYVLALGDDDVLIVNSIKLILSIIKNNADAGIIFLNSFEYKESLKPLLYKDREVSYKTYKSQKSFLYCVTYYVTFISGNIVNKKAIDQIDFEPWLTSYLVQVPLILTAIKTFENNIVVNSKLLSVQAENTGGYNIYKIFGKNLRTIVTAILTDKYSSYKKIILNDLSIRFFPYWVCRLKVQSDFENSIQKHEVLEQLDNNLYTQIFVRPLLAMPKNVSKSYLLFIKAYGYLRRRLSNLIYSK